MTRIGPARGTALRQHAVHIRFEAIGKPGARPDAKLAPRIAEIRKLLRTDMPLNEIAAALDVSEPTLKNLIRRRNICNLRERRHFISLQKSLARLDDRPERADESISQPVPSEA